MLATSPDAAPQHGQRIGSPDVALRSAPPRPALLPNLRSPGGLSGLIAIILRGVDTARPDLGVPLGLTQGAAALYPQTLTACLGRLAAPDSFGGLAPADLIRPDADSRPVIAALGAQDPEDLQIRTPVQIHQGTADAAVFKAFTDPLVEDYRERGVPVTYKVYDGVDHGGAVKSPTSARDATSFIRARLRSCATRARWGAEP
jgi:fermentation-respiration switch protein FrsA (DUF1100 family)